MENGEIAGSWKLEVGSLAACNFVKIYLLFRSLNSGWAGRWKHEDGSQKSQIIDFRQLAGGYIEVGSRGKFQPVDLL